MEYGELQSDFNRLERPFETINLDHDGSIPSEEELPTSAVRIRSPTLVFLHGRVESYSRGEEAVPTKCHDELGTSRANEVC